MVNASRRRKGGKNGASQDLMAVKSRMIPDADIVHYSYRPSIMGGACEFRLTADALDWKVGARSGHMPLRAVRRVRMSFKPASMQLHRFVTELWADDQPRIVIISTSWKSMVEQERCDDRYTAFVTALHRRMARAEAAPRFIKGSPTLLFWPGLAFFVVAALMMAALVPQALQGGSILAAAVVCGFLALFVWHGGNFFRRNKPGFYEPEALPRELLPKG
jgi:hypothetical protein